MPPTLEDKIKAATSQIRGQRRDVTVLDLTCVYEDGPALAQRAEALFLLEQELIAAWAEAVYEYEGHIDRASGQGLRVLFGAPLTHENDAERAAHVALHLQQRMLALLPAALARYGLFPRFGIGINSGVVIISAATTAQTLEYTVVGDTVRTAAQLAAMADSNSILVSAATWRVAQPIFQFARLAGAEPHAEAPPVYQLLGLRAKPGRIRGLPEMQVPMVGRGGALARMEACLATVAAEGTLHTVLLTGEAGVGKSRLLLEFQTRMQADARYGALRWLAGNCYAHTRTRPYGVILDLLRNIIGISDRDAPEAQLRALTDFLQTRSGFQPNTRLFLAYLLGLDQLEESLAAHIRRYDANTLHDLLQPTVASFLTVALQKRGVVLLVEDLHWVDPASWRLLVYLAGALRETAVMLVLTARTLAAERQAELQPPALLCLQLETLTHAENVLLVQQLLGQSSARAAQLAERIAGRAAGNPFFTEEIVRALIEAGGVYAAGSEWQIHEQVEQHLQTVPGALRALILARFDQLGAPEQMILQTGAVLGQSFTGRLLAAVEGQEAQHASARLERLIERQFLLIDELTAAPEYRFRHALLQEAVYDTLLRRQRQRLHGAVAAALEAHPDWYPAQRDELLAHHHLNSRSPQNALPYFLRAADAAARRFANDTALAHYEQALALLDADRPVADTLEFGIRVGLGRTLKFVGEYERAEQILEETLQRLLLWSLQARPESLLVIMTGGIRELADIAARRGNYDAASAHLTAGITALGENGAARHPVLYRSLAERMVFVRFRQGQLQEAASLARQAVNHLVPEEVTDPLIVASIFNTLGGIHWQQGDLDEASRYVGQALQLFENLGYLSGIADALSNLGVLAVQQGDWHSTLAYWERALAQRREIGDLHGQTISLMNLAQLRVSMGDTASAARELAEALALLAKLADVFGQARAHTIMARAALAQKTYDTVLAEANEALLLAGEDGAREIQVEARWIMAEAYGGLGAPRDGLTIAQEALAQAIAENLQDARADCLRVAGSLHGLDGDSVRGETLLLESIELCRQLNDPFRQGLGLLALTRLIRDRFAPPLALPASWYEKAQTAAETASVLLEKLGAQGALAEAQALLRQLEQREPVAEPQAPATRRPAPPAPTGERREATILWLQVALTEDEDDDELVFETLAYVLPACAAIAQEFGGQVRQRSDGLTVAFGVPRAFEDDAERAVGASLRILAFLRQPEVADAYPVAARLVVTQGPLLAGPAAGAAAHLLRGAPLAEAQAAAAVVPPAAVWVSEAVLYASQRLFTFQSTPLEQDGVGPLWRAEAVRAAPAPSRGVPGTETDFLGRDDALQAMSTLAENLAQGLGGIIWIEGEAGIGKSRLMREFAAMVGDARTTVWSGGCSPQRANHPFSLFSDLLLPVLGVHPNDPLERINRSIEEALAGWPDDARQALPYLQMLSGVRPDGVVGERLGRLEPEQLRQQTFVALRRLLITLSRRRQLVLLLDDLHWIDPISAELLVFVATTVVNAPVLFVCAQRREGGDAPNDRLLRLQGLLPGQTLHRTLDRLPPDVSRLLLQRLLPNVTLPEALLALVVARSEGNPYFIEEFVRMLIEKGYVSHGSAGWEAAADLDLAALNVPQSLQTLIRSRVDALPAELKQTLQAAAILGQTFELRLLEALSGRPDLRIIVGRLASRLMLRKGSTPDQWAFSHTLIETIVYEGMLDSDRRAAHGRVAMLLAADHSADHPEQAKTLAYHYLRAGEERKALPYLIMAGEHAADQRAEEEALQHFSQAEAILADMPEPAETWQWRVTVGLGDVYRFMGQYADAMAMLEKGLPLLENGQLARKGQADLYRRLGDTARKKGDYEVARRYLTLAQDLTREPSDNELRLELARTLLGLSWVHYGQGQFQQARAAGEESLVHAQAVDGLGEQAAVHNLLGGIHYRIGAWRDALHHTTRAMVLWEQMDYTWGVAMVLGNLGILAFSAGHWPKAISFFERSLALRREMGDMEGVVIVENNLANAYRGQGNAVEAEVHFRESVINARAFEIAFHFANSSVGLAHVVLWQGRVAEAAQILEEGLRKAEAIQAQDIVAEARRVLAEIRLAQGDSGAALHMAQDAAALAAAVGNVSYQAAAWRVAAAAGLALGNGQLARAHIGRAEALLSEATDEIEMAHVAAQAYQIYTFCGAEAQAKACFQTAREIYARLRADRFLERLEAAGAGAVT